MGGVNVLSSLWEGLSEEILWLRFFIFLVVTTFSAVIYRKEVCLLPPLSLSFSSCLRGSLFLKRTFVMWWTEITYTHTHAHSCKHKQTCNSTLLCLHMLQNINVMMGVHIHFNEIVLEFTFTKLIGLYFLTRSATKILLPN